MELFQLEQFLAIADSPSMRAAAEKLYLSQPTLSHNLKKLEDELGCQLFDRTNNSLVLNSYGEIVVEYARQILDDWGGLKRAVDDERERRSAKLEVGCYALSFQQFTLPQLANALSDIVVESHLGTVDALAEQLKDASLDLLLTYKPLQEPGFVDVKLFDEQVMLSLPSSAELATHSCIYLADLPKANIHLVPTTLGYTDWFTAVLAAAGISADRVPFAPLDTYLQHKDSSTKTYLTTSFIMRLVPSAPKQVLIPIADEVARRSIYLSYRDESNPPVERAVAFFTQNADRYFGSYLKYLAFPEAISNLILDSDRNSESTDS